MNKLAVVCRNKRIKYLYLEDFNTKEKVISFFNAYGMGRAALYEDGAEYLDETYSDELNTIGVRAGFNEEEMDSFLYDLRLITIPSNTKFQVLSKKDIENSIIGNIGDSYDPKNEILLSEGRLKLDEAAFLNLFEEALLNIQNIKKNENKWIFFMQNLYRYAIYDSSIQWNNYNFEDIYEMLFVKDTDIECNLRKVILLLEDYIKAKDKPLYERNVPDSIKERILSHLYEKEEPTKEDKKTFIKFMNDLVAKDNPYGLWVKCYSHYGGNEYVGENYKISEECLLKLIDIDYNDNYSDTLGYIYYYGRVNNGIPEYEKAYKYYSLSALSGNVEARYKIGDMYKNGYYLEKNLKIAKCIYESLYNEVNLEFFRNPKNSSLADVSLRIAGFYDNDKDYLECYKLYLEALLALNIRKGQFDSTIRRGVIKSIKEVYSKYKEKILQVGLDTVLDSLYDYYISYKKGVLYINFDRRTRVFDYKNIYAVYSDQVEIKITGRVLKKFNTNVMVDEIGREGDVYTFYDTDGVELGKIKVEDYSIIQKYKFINNENDDEIYKIAICQYEKGIGKKYQFLYVGSPILDKEWSIIETNQIVYPIEFVELKGYELACDIKYMKHIK